MHIRLGGSHFDLAEHFMSTSSSGNSGHHLRQLCAQTAWKEGLWVHCHSNCGDDKRSVCGGLNNIRNRLQTCVRLAIDAGSGLILPTIATRDQERLKKLGGGKKVGAGSYFDLEHLESALAFQCPQLNLRFDGDTADIKVNLAAPKRQYHQDPHTQGTFRSLTEDVLSEGKIQDISATSPAVISFGDSFIGWNYTEADELNTIRKDLFSTLRYNPELLNIGSYILQSPELQSGFIGVHLRGEKDWPSSFGRIDRQMRLYTEEMEKYNAERDQEQRDVYVSCGNQTSIQIWREQLEPLGYRVHDKWTILERDTDKLAQLESLLFDEKGVIEYQMLLNADFFLGPAMSSMSSLIAFARTAEQDEDFFMSKIFPDSERYRNQEGWLRRKYSKPWMMKGDDLTKLLVVEGDDIMDAFP